MTGQMTKAATPTGGRKTGMTMAQQIGSKLRQRRRAAGVSLREIGEAVGISFVQIQRYEAGVSAISVTRLLAICQVLGVQVSTLFGEQPVLEQEQLDGRRHEAKELARLFATLTEPRDRRTILLMARAAAAREKLFAAGASPSPGETSGFRQVPQ